MKLTPVQQELLNIRTKLVLASAKGSFNNFKNLKREQASYMLKHFEETRNVPMPRLTVNLFSIAGIHMVYIMLRNKFSHKYDAEKELEKLLKTNKDNTKLMKHITYD